MDKSNFSQNIRSKKYIAALALKRLKSSVRVHLLSEYPKVSECNVDEIFTKLQITDKVQDELSNTIDKALSSELKLISLFDQNYPESLKEIYDPPPIMFLAGETNLLSSQSLKIAIVGSRGADKEGIDLAREMGCDLAKAGVIVVSGLALGIDAAAHFGATESEKVGPTIAVLGNGLPEIWPASNRDIGRRIIEQGGCLVSQFEPGAPPFPQHFLDRNRVISGLSKAVVVIQAGERSGSLVTARYALEQGREVMTVPGSIKNPRYSGSLKILKEGATLVTSAKDILQALGLETTNSDSELSPTLSHPILDLLKEKGSMSIDELRLALSSPADFATQLLELELQQVLTILPGNFVAIP